MNEKMEAAGFMDFIRSPIEHIKEALSPIPTKLNNVSTRTLQQYGNQHIQRLIIIRSPLKSHWTGALNLISMGKFDELKNKYGFDKLFHLSLIAVVNNTDIIIEKNEVIHVALLNTKSRMGADTEQFNVPMQGKIITLNEMLDKTKKLMGDVKFYDYDALGGNNCQDFVRALLRSVGLSSQQAENFIFQDVSKITKGLLEDKSVDYVPALTKKITNIGSRLSRIIGKGKSKNNTKIDPLTELILKIDKGGWEFI